MTSTSSGAGASAALVGADVLSAALAGAGVLVMAAAGVLSLLVALNLQARPALSGEQGGLPTLARRCGPVLGRHRLALQAVSDAGAWVAGLGLAHALRVDLATQVEALSVVLVAVLAVLLHLAIGTALQLYRGRYRFGSPEEILGLLTTVGVSALSLVLLDVALPGPRLVPGSIPLAGGLAALSAMAGSRHGWRLLLDRTRSNGEGAPLLVFGTGEAGEQVVRSLLTESSSPYRPVALLDDDPRKRHLRVAGVPVVGNRSVLRETARRTGARTLLIAVPSADRATVAELATLGAQAGLEVKVLPSVVELLGERVDAADIRDLDVADLLGRPPVATDLESVAGYLTGRRVLVTGAGGSIGRELCRQIRTHFPAQLVMLDRDESALHALQLELTGRALLDSPDLALADIRDVEQVRAVFELHQPEVVFHAAALKHLPLLESHPGEALKSNVWGTLAVLDAAVESGVQRFVNVSTDKAANPISVLGRSKRIAERLTAWHAQQLGLPYLSVRFGNVLGSRGSVLASFAAQVDAGGPVTVTHPDITRYFMTVSEAVHLVIQAGAIGRPGEALVLDMGEPVRIADVARRLADRAPVPVEVVYTGLRPGEKLHEDLFGDGEVDHRPVHPLISHVAVPPLDPLTVRGVDPWADRRQVAATLRGLCTKVVPAGTKLSRGSVGQSADLLAAGTG